MASGDRKDGPIEVAIVGGGCAGIAAAFELTRPCHQGRYQVTLYQLGWRLGGKGASGRGPSDRIEEHGIHVWYGCYENAFRLLRECYGELQRDPATARFHDWHEGFRPGRTIGVVDSAAGQVKPWIATFKDAAGLPGDPIGPQDQFGVAHYLVRSADLLLALLRSARGGGDGEIPLPHWTDRSPTDPMKTLRDLTRYSRLASLDVFCRALACLRQILGTRVSTLQQVQTEILGWFQHQVRGQLNTLMDHDDELRRIWEVADLILAFQRGAMHWRLLSDARGFDAIEHLDLRQWLRDNGASERALRSAFLRGLYDICFAYEEADPARPRLAAGQGLRTACRLFFAYRGPFYWRMNAGMGDVVFAPFFEVLRQRGVRFEFFHRLREVELSRPDEESHVRALHFDVQAELVGGETYQPLIDVRGMPCWPNLPRWSQLVDGDRLAREGCDFEDFRCTTVAGTKTLRVGANFDCVVLAVGLGAIPYVGRQLLVRDRRWRKMVEKVGTVATQAFQLWLRTDPSDLGWYGAAGNLAGFVEPFNTWTDMSHLADEESWGESPRTIAYFCSMMRTPDGAKGDSAEPSRQVAEAAIRFLNQDIQHLWPRAASRDGGFLWDLLAGADAGDRDEKRFYSQYWAANVNPSDRYVQSLPGSARYRISPLDCSWGNLTVAGDWTQCGFNAGSVESAVMSGRLAAHAISRSPALAEIVGYDHP